MLRTFAAAASLALAAALPATAQEAVPEGVLMPIASAERSWFGFGEVEVAELGPVPVSGANSFTEAQARSRLEGQGFTDVSPLLLGRDGVWRGAAMRDGTDRSVAVDYTGSVVAR